MSDPASQSRRVSEAVPPIADLKALAHVDRLRILASLRLDGASTATRLGRRLGLNSGATSYHLRRLAAHGFIEADPELGNGREKWWRARHESTRYDTAELSGDQLETGLAFTQAVLSAHAAMMQRALQHYRDLPVAWRSASTASDVIIPLTADEAKALTEKLFAVMTEVQRAHPPVSAPQTAEVRPFAVVLHAFPYPTEVGGPGQSE